MKERPILFNSEMVRAILAGAKTQTRRVIKPQPIKPTTAHCPYGQPGDWLWVRETWALCEGEAATSAMYRATFDNRYLPQPSAWRPSIFMPRAYSRIALEIIDVRVQRVRDITEADAVAEGMLPVGSFALGADLEKTAKDRFALLWDSINEKRGYGWESNPWVWALTFRPV